METLAIFLKNLNEYRGDAEKDAMRIIRWQRDERERLESKMLAAREATNALNDLEAIYELLGPLCEFVDSIPESPKTEAVQMILNGIIYRVKQTLGK